MAWKALRGTYSMKVMRVVEAITPRQSRRGGEKTWMNGNYEDRM